MFGFRPRITVRRLMVVVAIVGLFIGIALEVSKLRRLSSRYDAMANDFATNARKYRELAVHADSMASTWWTETDGMHDEDMPASKADVDRRNRLARHHASLAQRYRRAARQPWSSVEPAGPPTE